MKRPLVLAHRGLHAVHPENSLAAFRAAFDVGADGIECDVQKGPDGSFVVVHDPPPAPRGCHAPPRLDAMLASLPPGAFLNLELKADTLRPSDCPRIFEALARRPFPGPVLVSSFDPRLLPYFKARGTSVGLLVGEEAARLGWAGMTKEIRRLRPDYLNLPILMFEILGKRRARLLALLFRALGFSLAFWTVNRREEVDRVRKLARIIITDEVLTVRRAL
ncbi:MAG TPA: glycerophosphodiester phosphodiesterase [Spirochaetia bacterium]|nr:glycerophosphodiester phosphodiesterase [Spirochaetia bacterium]